MLLRTAGILARSLVLTAAVGTTVFVATPQVSYPPTRTVDHVDTYHGTRVADPYRWLEDDNAPETAAWVEAQNGVTFDYLERIPFRAALRARLEELYDYPRYTAPTRRGGRFFFTRNDGLQNQSVLYVQEGLDGAPEVLIDPNTWSADGTVRLTTFSLSKDGRHAVYGVSKSGSDWQDLRVMEIATRRTLPDTIEWVKVSGASWAGEGFFYSRYPAPEKGRELSSKNEDHRVYFHRVGTAQAEDVLVHADPANPQRFHGVQTTEDERFAVLSVSDRGRGKQGNALFVRNLSTGETGFRPLVPDIGDDTYSIVGNVGDALLLRTNRGAPNYRVVRVDPSAPAESNWATLIAERPEPLQSASLAGGRLFVTYLKDVTTRAYVHRLDGSLEHEVVLPGLGAAGGFGGRSDDTFVFYTFTSFTVPPSIYRFDIASRQSTVFRTPEIPGYDPAAYETRQVFYTSKDGTRVPMFLVHRRGIALDGANPTLLYGYGGFNVVQAPGFSSLRLALLEQGFVYASANLRGGGEYGESWHLAGTKLRKQNVFDDFIAAAEWLVANKYTSPARLAIQGGSNGGLLVGAVMNQRPDLFRVAVPQVGVMDMLRFHKFTIGWNWIADYGSSDDPAEFAALAAYSPLHNIRAGTTYPATLITTADHDDRVVPAHSFKYAATLQAKAAPGRPALIRIETKSGHGASSTRKQIETTADVYAFIMHNLGVTPATPSGWDRVSDPLFTAHRLTAPGSFSQNAEGPEFTREGRLFAVNCERDGTICEVHPDGRAEVFVTLPAGSTANAIREDSRGHLLLADYTGHNVLRLDPRTRQVSAWVHDDRFSQPNDLAISRDDVVYASDPDWKAGTGRVWRIGPAADVSLLAGDLGTANGITLSPDERTLYVAESVQRRILAFPLDAEGRLAGARRVVAEFPDHGLDGIKCDASGRLFVTRHGKGTVAVLDVSGRVEREVVMPGKSVSNVVFGGPDLRRVFVTLQDTKDMHWFAADIAGARAR